jgi:uncharacterized membrane protein YidH (DUF202 family)
MNDAGGPRGGIFDPGLQPERTTLAWRRTTLSLAVGSLIALRLLPPILGAWSLVAGITGVVLAAMIWILAGRRGGVVEQTLLHRRGQMPGGGLLLLVGGTVTLGGLLGLFYVLAR